MTDYLLSIDQGTTSSRAILFTTGGDIAHVAQQEFEQHFPDDGWVEHNPEDIWQTVLSTCREVLGKLGTGDRVIAIGITNQRETTLVWDRKTGEPVYNAIVWQDRRTADFCAELKAQGQELAVSDKTGLLLDPYFSGTKVRWILENVDGVRERAERGELAFGTVDTFLLWRLTGGTSHFTDPTNASRTLMFDIHTQAWDEALLNMLSVPRSMLPEVKDSSDDFGVTAADVFEQQIPIYGIAGDQQAALFGQACFEQGDTKSTYGTGCFMMANTGSKALSSKNRLLTTVGYRIDGQTTYALEGSIFIAGAAIQWLRDGLKLIKSASETEALAEQVKHNEVVMVPAFTGLGAPYWDPNARGALFGLTRDTGIKEVVAAALQSVCFQTMDLQRAMESDGQKPTTIRVDGGLTANSWAMQFLSDVLGAPVDRPKVIETTALGVAYLAGLKAGVYESLDALKVHRESERVFQANMLQSERDALYERWQWAVERVRSNA